MLKFYYSLAPNPRKVALFLDDRYKFKTEMDEQARRAMFPLLYVRRA